MRYVIKNRFQKDDWLMEDEESGIVYHASEMVRIWDGSWRHRKNIEFRNPQEFVEAKNDPIPLEHIRSDELVATPTSASSTVGNTSVASPTGPASHLFK